MLLATNAETPLSWQWVNCYQVSLCLLYRHLMTPILTMTCYNVSLPVESPITYLPALLISPLPMVLCENPMIFSIFALMWSISLLIPVGVRESHLQHCRAAMIEFSLRLFRWSSSAWSFHSLLWCNWFPFSGWCLRMCFWRSSSCFCLWHHKKGKSGSVIGGYGTNQCSKCSCVALFLNLIIHGGDGWLRHLLKVCGFGTVICGLELEFLITHSLCTTTITKSDKIW